MSTKHREQGLPGLLTKPVIFFVANCPFAAGITQDQGDTQHISSITNLISILPTFVFSKQPYRRAGDRSQMWSESTGGIQAGKAIPRAWSRNLSAEPLGAGIAS